MIEAVNSVLSNAVLARGSAEQQSVARSYAANPERVQEVAQAPYVSPYISMNLNYNKAVLQIRDSDTGDVVRQFPSESQLEAYRKAQATVEDSETLNRVREASQSQQAPAPERAPATASAPVSEPKAPAPSPAPVSVDA